ncbi:NADH-quinone oxidoreductase subunit A [Stygiolobus caldivivus]|uniref:NADH dehydrogenase subunit A n=1 Tax=Stygiolobus caldivivus TaxID=2824673 RepID=A0A8D5ZII8_9CREN|nr:NADH-quinone oxidoreductase subunit A [Stygiolobus caldivivus]BCU69332.1 NADH dehydrogenase subunit A [Stygiolobus caldivivus]
MAFTQAILAFGLPLILFLAAGYGGYKILSLAVEGRFNPIKVSRFEAGNIPFGEGRLWFPLQYYGYLLVYTSIEPIIVLLFSISEASYFTSLVLFRNLLIIVLTTIAVLYPVLYYAIKQVNIIQYWLIRR